MSRKPANKPSSLSREEALERRLADLERIVRRIPVVAAQQTATATSIMVQQVSHGLSVGNVVRPTGTSTWVKSKADTASSARVGGVVSSVLSPDLFIATTSGRVSGLSLSPTGTVHYLSATTAGGMTSSPPAIAIPVIYSDGDDGGVLMSPSDYIAPSSDPYGLNGRYLRSMAAGTFSIPAYVKWIRAYVVGAGGGGGGGASSTIVGYIASSSGGSPTTSMSRYIGGSGGSSGDVVIIDVNVAESGITTIPITIGSAGGGGAAGVNGTAGGSTTISFGSYVVTARGGVGGANGSVSESVPTSVLTPSSPGDGILALSLRGNPGRGGKVMVGVTGGGPFGTGGAGGKNPLMFGGGDGGDGGDGNLGGSSGSSGAVFLSYD